MHVRVVVEMVGCYLQFSKYVMYATDRFVLKYEEVAKSQYLTGVSQSGLGCASVIGVHAGSILS